MTHGFRFRSILNNLLLTASTVVKPVILLMQFYPVISQKYVLPNVLFVVCAHAWQYVKK